MKNADPVIHRFRPLAVCALLAAVFIASLALAEGFALDPALLKKAKKDVMDYYLLLPPEYLSLGGHPLDIAGSTGARKAAVAVKDIRNGFLRIQGAWEGWMEIALFRRPDGSDIIAVFTASCGPGCSTEKRFLELKGGAWSEVTKKVFPEIAPERMNAVFEKKMKGRRYDKEIMAVNYRLPRLGTTIKVVVDPSVYEGPGEVLLFNIDWKNGGFVVREAP